MLVFFILLYTRNKLVFPIGVLRRLVVECNCFMNLYIPVFMDLHIMLSSKHPHSVQYENHVPLSSLPLGSNCKCSATERTAENLVLACLLYQASHLARGQTILYYEIRCLC